MTDIHRFDDLAKGDGKGRLTHWAATQLKQQVADGIYGEGERLPSQRDLATAMGVSRTVLREAISALESSGVLRTEPGSGTFVAAVSAKPSPSPDPEAVVVAFSGDYAKLDACRFRYVLEPACARLAAMRVTDDDIAALHSNLSVFKEQIRRCEYALGAATDIAFHHLIVSMAGVPLFTDLHGAMTPLLLSVVTLQRSVQSRGWEAAVEHERVLEALKRRDPDEASYYMQSHITRSSELLGLVEAGEIL